MYNKIRTILMGALVALWLGLTAFCWLQPAKDISLSERRPLAQFPQASAKDVLSGDFMTDFESYSLDQFPLRDSFRRLKAIFHYNILQQQDNNNIYIAGDYAAKLEYPLNTDGVNHALSRFNWIYENLLKEADGKIYAAVIPDKSYYLAEENGYPAMDYDALFDTVKEKMPWANHIDLTQSLTIDAYYRTDLHWRQEMLLPVAKKLADTMGVHPLEETVKTLIDKPFYGVYHGQAALPLPTDDLYILESDLLKECKVFHYDTNSYTEIYDRKKLESKDLYDIYLSGPQSLLRIENPNATTDKELIVFRDSFGSSLVPLLVQNYKTVTLVDIRYLSSQMLSRYLEFSTQDILFLYSTTVLNNGSIFK